MKVASIETLYCDAGWRPWIFLKVQTDDGLVGWAEVTDSHGSPRGLAGIVEDLAPLVVGLAGFYSLAGPPAVARAQQPGPREHRQLPQPHQRPHPPQHPGLSDDVPDELGIRRG